MSTQIFFFGAIQNNIQIKNQTESTVLIYCTTTISSQTARHILSEVPKL